MFRGVDRSFLGGLREALDHAGVEHQLAIEATGSTVLRDQVLEKVQRLLLERSPDVVTGIMGVGVSRHVHPRFSEAQVPFILNDMGADPLMQGGVRNPFLVSNSLNLWQSVYALGYWAAHNLGNRACIAAALHEAGYGMVQAFWLGFHHAAGGTVVATEVTHRASADEDATAALQRLAEHGPDFVMAFYSGREGISFSSAWDALGLRDKFPLAATPMMFHGQWLPAIGARVESARTASSWNPDAGPAEYDHFHHAVKAAPSDRPAVFALLGYETGLMIAAALERSGHARGLELAEAFAGLTVRSPRGTVHIDAASGETVTSDYLQQVRCGDDGAPAVVTLEQLPLPPAFAGDYARVSRAEDRSGWFNPYLIT